MTETRLVFSFVVLLQGWYAKFLLKIDLEFLLGKTTARLNLKIDLTTLHTHPDSSHGKNRLAGSGMLNWQGPLKHLNCWQLCFDIMLSHNLILWKYASCCKIYLRSIRKGWQPLKKYISMYYALEQETKNLKAGLNGICLRIKGCNLLKTQKRVKFFLSFHLSLCIFTFMHSIFFLFKTCFLLSPEEMFIYFYS